MDWPTSGNLTQLELTQRISEWLREWRLAFLYLAVAIESDFLTRPTHD